MPYVRKKSRRGHHHYDGSSYEIRCRHCRNRTPGLITFNGVPVRTTSCSACVCQNALQGNMCPNPRRMGSIHCDYHMKCTHAACPYIVKESNPKTFHFCKAHSCKAPHCPDRREGDSSFCTAHKCTKPGCNEGRHPSGRSSYCTKHTCESPECGNLVVYEGDVPAGDPKRFCDVHKRCTRADCVRHCYMRDDGSMASFCGEHRCHSGACAKEREGGQFCVDHTCKWRPGHCRNGFAHEAGSYCSDHECARAECREPRERHRGGGSTFCRDHKCRDVDCAKEVHGETEWCEKHQPCATEGCRRQRVMEGEKVTDHCEQHTPPNCAWHQPKCTKRPVDNGKFCDDHTCTVRDCTEERDPSVRRSKACVDHKCTVEGCPDKRQNESVDFMSPIVHHTFCQRHGCQSRLARCTGQAIDNSRYCKRHSCAVQDCQEEARGPGGKLCPDHALLRQQRMVADAAARAGVNPLGIVPGLGGVGGVPPPAVPFGMDPGIVMGGGVPPYGFGMPPPVVPGGGVMPGVGYQYGPGQTRYHYQF